MTARLSGVALLPSWMSPPVPIEGVRAAELRCTAAEDAAGILRWHGRPLPVSDAVQKVMSGVGGFYSYPMSTARNGLEAACEQGWARTFRYRGVWMVESC